MSLLGFPIIRYINIEDVLFPFSPADWRAST
jgi:hypothetical protein